MKMVPLVVVGAVLSASVGCSSTQELRDSTDPTKHVQNLSPNGSGSVSSADQVDLIAVLTRKAEAGDPHAQNDLGSRYQAGDGVAIDMPKAVALYAGAAVSGDAIAESNLGFMYDLGLGTERNRSLANEWYRKSAEQGYAPAMMNLGINIAGGQGAPQDVIEGMKWVDLARFFTQSERDMKVKWRIRGAYDYLRKGMTKAQFDEAQRRSREWYEQFKATKAKG